MASAMQRRAIIECLAEKIAHRRRGCPILLAVEIGSAVGALELSQGEVDHAFAIADARLDEKGGSVHSGGGAQVDIELAVGVHSAAMRAGGSGEPAA
jgi:hypothetical protein